MKNIIVGHSSEKSHVPIWALGKGFRLVIAGMLQG